MQPNTLSIRPLPKKPYITIHQLDASAAVKLVLQEPGSDNLRPYFQTGRHFLITTLCLAEALGALKRKMLEKKLSRKEYFDRCYLLIQYVRSHKTQLDEV